MDFDKGPFHMELFPYDYFELEIFLLEGKTNSENTIENDTENILVEISLI